MAGSARQPGSGEHNWPELVKQASKHTQTLGKLAPGVGPEYEAGPDKVRRLEEVHNCLRDVAALVDNVRRRIVPGTDVERELARPLGVFSGSVTAAGEAVDDLKLTIVHELHKRLAEEETHRYRSNKKFVKDQRELRALSGAAAGKLTEILGHMDQLQASLRRLTLSNLDSIIMT